MDIAKRVTELLDEHGISLYKLSSLTGIPYSTLSGNLKRGAQMTVANLELICSALGITVSEFFNEIPPHTENARPAPLSDDEIESIREILKGRNEP